MAASPHSPTMRLAANAIKQAWANARIAASPLDTDKTPNSDVLDKLIVWCMNAPSIYNPNREDGKMAQRSWTIEVRADFADASKNDTITAIVLDKAVELHANLELAADGQKPDIACWSEDFFQGRTDLALHAKKNMVPGAVDQYKAQIGEGIAVTDELLAAAAEVMHEKNSKK